jgi:hypothetical protein
MCSSCDLSGCECSDDGRFAKVPSHMTLLAILLLHAAAQSLIEGVTFTVKGKLATRPLPVGSVILSFTITLAWAIFTRIV